MAETTTIEWTEATWQIVTGCSIATPGCTNCYAMRLAGSRLQHHPSRVGLTRNTKAGPVWTGEVRFNEQWLTQPLQWKRPRKIFVAAHGDLFHEAVPDDVLDRVFAVMALCPQHTFQVLTKRADRMRAYMTRWPHGAARVHHVSSAAMRILLSNKRGWNSDSPEFKRSAEAVATWPLPNVWLGVSVEDQRRADERIPDLLATPAAVRWISAEPLLGPVDLERITVCVPGEPEGFHHYLNALTGEVYDDENGTIDGAYGDEPAPRLNWVVDGGESGPGARPAHPQWFRDLRDQCLKSGTAYLHKQNGAWVDTEGWYADHSVSLPIRRWTGTEWTDRWDPNEVASEWVALVGKKAAGRLLDGVEHNGFPGGAG